VRTGQQVERGEQVPLRVGGQFGGTLERLPGAGCGVVDGGQRGLQQGQADRGGDRG
jgi:hypothetical protein